MAAVCVKQEELLNVFSLRVINVLTGQADNSIPLSKFTTAYEQLYGQKLCVQNFGCASLDDLLSVVSPVAKVGKIFNQNLYKPAFSCISHVLYVFRFTVSFLFMFGSYC